MARSTLLHVGRRERRARRLRRRGRAARGRRDRDRGGTRDEQIADAGLHRAPPAPDVISQASTSPFSCAVQARFSTSLQLRLNHFSTDAGLLKRSGFAAGASGSMRLPVTACSPAALGSLVWHDAQLQSPPWVAPKNCCAARRREARERGIRAARFGREGRFEIRGRFGVRRCDAERERRGNQERGSHGQEPPSRNSTGASVAASP